MVSRAWLWSLPICAVYPFIPAFICFSVYRRIGSSRKNATTTASTTMTATTPSATFHRVRMTPTDQNSNRSANEQTCEVRFHVANRERAEQLGGAVEDIGVMRVGMDCDHLVDRHEMGDAVPLDRKVAGKPARRRAGAPERRVGPLADVRTAGAVAGR